MGALLSCFRHRQTDSNVLSNIVRPLGGVEDMFAAYSDAGSMTFSVACEVQGEITERLLRSALQSLQRRHKRLTLAIRQNGDSKSRRFFVHTGQDIPLKTFSRSQATSWEKLVAEDLAEPFEPEKGALLRTTALLGGQGLDNILILTFHHSLADGFSAMAVLEDLLFAISGQDWGGKESPWVETMEDWLGSSLFAEPKLPLGPPPDLSIVRNKWAVQRTNIPKVTSYSFSEESTAIIARRSKEEKTTVHGALLAAMAQARHDEAPKTYPAKGLRIMSPINARTLYDKPSDQVGVYITSAITTSLPSDFTASGTAVPGTDGNPNFWDQARNLQQTVSSARCKDSVIAVATVAELQIRRDASPEAVTEFMRVGMDHEGLLSNLGKLSLKEQFGSYQVKQVWGPALRTCIDHEDTVGAGTFGGRLRLVHTTVDGPLNLVGRMAEIVEAQSMTTKDR